MSGRPSCHDVELGADRYVECAIDLFRLGRQNAMQTSAVGHLQFSPMRGRVVRRSAGTAQAPGIGRTGMISMHSPGKFVKCGCFSNSLAAASCEAARTIV